MRRFVALPWVRKLGPSRRRPVRIVGGGVSRDSVEPGGAEGALLCWCAVGRHRLTLARSRQVIETADLTMGGARNRASRLPPPLVPVRARAGSYAAFARFG